ncbi:uncharacterized protein LOC144138151 [Haemaphysalis longicornis]
MKLFIAAVLLASLVALCGAWGRPEQSEGRQPGRRHGHHGRHEQERGVADEGRGEEERGAGDHHDRERVAGIEGRNEQERVAGIEGRYAKENGMGDEGWSQETAGWRTEGKRHHKVEGEAASWFAHGDWPHAG